ncbi:Ig-like domain-containing protein [Orbus wheelerorum]|uniref:Ig-like domain-containing protein n=1 Tax=Orbus wheelerorum TaxID=3074111 RepID=UPI00370D603C
MVRIVLIMQILFPLFVSANSVASAINLNSEDIKNKQSLSNIKNNLPELSSASSESTDSAERSIAAGLSQTGTLISSDNTSDATRDWLENSAYGYLSNEMQTWLNQYGNSRIQINSNGNYSAELLVPWFENKNNLFFSQSRISREDGNKSTLNLGLGYRNYLDNWMWGVNSFYDRDLKNNNARLGAGFEFGANYLKLSTNGYFRLTDWRQSKLDEFNDYDERPANGFDIRAEGYLPSYPNLGGNLLYEKYFGENVNLKGSSSLSNLKDDPEAYTVGLSYTPVPLFSFKLNQTMGDVTETKGIFELNYRMGVPLAQQLNEKFVAEMRTLQGSRYDFVDRNNAIVMQYKKQVLLRIALPKTLSIIATKPEILIPTITKNKYKIDRIEWSSPALTAKGGTIIPSSSYPYSATILMPFYDYVSTLAGNSYDITAVAVDVNGNRSNIATTNILVSPKPINEVFSTFTISPNTDIVGDGEAQGLVTVVVKDSNTGDLLADVAVNFTLVDSQGAAVDGIKLDGNSVSSLSRMTDSNGAITFPITSIKSGEFTLNATINDRESSNEKISFIADESTAQINTGDVTVTGGGALVGSDTETKIKVKVTDQNGNPVPNQDVTFTADNGATITPTGRTDENGMVEVIVSNKTAGRTNISVKVGLQEILTGVDFIADITSAQISFESRGSYLAGRNSETFVKAIVTDKNGNIISNREIAFTANNEATFGENESTTFVGKTNDDGVIEIALNSKKATEITVTATVTAVNISSDTAVSFVADDSNVQFEFGDNGVVDDAVAGTDTPVKVIVKDANGNPVIDKDITFTTKNEAGETVTSTGKTNDKGEVDVIIKDNTAGSSTITAELGNSKGSAEITVVPDSRSAKINAMDVVKKEAVANGEDVITAIVTVTDKYNNVLKGQKITFTASNDVNVAEFGETDAEGKVTINLTHTKAGDSAIEAAIVNAQNEPSSIKDNIKFVADDTSAQFEFDVIGDPVAGADTTVKVKVTDKNGNPIIGKDVSFTADNGATITPMGKTDENGMVEVIISNNTAGNTNATAKVGDIEGNVVVDFSPDESTAQIATMETAIKEAVANGKDTISVIVTVTDANNNVLKGQKIAFTASNNASVAGFGDTDDKGQVTITLSSIKSGVSDIKASLTNAKGQQSAKEDQVSFVADDSNVKFEFGNNGVVDDAVAGTDTPVKVIVKDVNGNPVIDKDITFTTKNEAGETVTSTGKTNDKGEVEVIIKDNTAGSSTITAELGDSKGSADVKVVADKTTAQITTMETAIKEAVANGKDTISVIVTVTDANNNVLNGQKIAFTASNNANVAEFGETDDNGQVTITLSSIKAGVSDIKASLTNAKGQQSAKEDQVSFVADDSNVKFEFGNNGVVDDAVAGTDTPVKVIVKDANGNPVIDKDITFTTKNEAGETVTSTGKTNDKGEVDVVISDNTAGNSTITAELGESKGSTDVKVVADKTTAQITAMETAIKEAVANGEDIISVIVTVKDANNNVLNGQKITFTASNNVNVAEFGETDDNGQVTITLSSIKAGVSDIKSSLTNAKGQQSAKEDQVSFVADDSNVKFEFGNNGVVDDAVAGTDTPVKVIVKDANGNPVIGKDVTITTKNEAGETVTSTGKTNDKGEVEVVISDNTAGNSTITAELGDNKGSTDVKVVADKTTAQITTMETAIKEAVANGKDTISVIVTVTDANNNVLNGQKVTFTASNNVNVAEFGETDDNGQVTITLTSIKAGVSDIKASLTNAKGQQSVKEDKVNFIADETSAQFEFDVIGEPIAGNDSTVKVKVTDANGNPIIGKDVSFTADNGTTITPTGKTDENGMVEVIISNNTVGNTTITAKVGDRDGSTLVYFSGDKTTAQIVTMEAAKKEAVADGKDLISVIVTVKDANNNVLKGQKITFTASNNVNIADFAETDDKGQVTIALSSIKSGESDLKASLTNAKGLLSVKEDKVNFIADDSTAKYEFDVGDDAVAGSDKTVIVKVTDANGNPIIGKDFEFVADNGATITPTGKTNENGEIEVVINNNTAGKTTVTAQDGGKVVGGVDVNVVADISSAKINSISSAGSKVAGRADATTVIVQVTDKYGNILINQNVSFVANNDATIASTGTTNDKGLIEVPLNSKKAINVTVQAKLGENEPSSIEVQFIADNVGATILDGNLTVEGGAEHIAGREVLVTALVTDANGNIIANQEVTFTTDKASATFKATSSGTASGTLTGITDKDGKVNVILVNPKAVLTTITAAVNGNKATTKVNFIADDSTAKYEFDVGDDAVAGSDKTVTVKVTDANGNPIIGKDVDFVADNGATITPTGKTNENGEIEVVINNNTAGKTTVTAKDGGKVVGGVDVNVVADISSAKINAISSAGSKVAGQVDATTVIVQVTDKYGNVIANQNVSLVADNDATIASTGTTNVQGLINVPLNSKKAINVTVQAKLGENEPSTIEVQFIADIASAQILDGNLTVEGGAEHIAGREVIVTALVTDANGNIIANQEVTFTTDKASATFKATSSGAASGTLTGITDKDGKVNVILVNPKASLTTITAAVNANKATTKVNFIADDSNVNFEFGDNGVVGDAIAGVDKTIKVKVTDKNGNPVIGKDVTFTTTDDLGNTTTQTGKTDENGLVDVVITDNTTGSKEVTANLGNSQGSTNINIIGNSDMAQIVIFKDNGSKVAGRDGETTVQVKVTDSYGNILPNQHVTFTANNEATISSTATTNAEGLIDLPLNSKKAVLVTVTATTGKAEPKEIGVQFIADVKTAKIVAGNVTVEDDRALIGGEKTNSVKVKVIDANSNNVPGLTVVLTADNGAIVGKIAETNADGEVLVTLTSNTTGESNVIASIKEGTQQEAYPAVKVMFIAQILDKDFMPGSNSAAANNVALNSVYAKVTDSKGKGVANQKVTFTVENTERNHPTFSNNDTTITVTTDENGAATTTLKNTKAGPTTVTAALFDSSPTTVVDFVGDTATRRIVVGNLTVETDNAIADGQATNSVKVKITDENDNPLPGELVTLTAKIYNGTVNVGNIAKTDANGEVVVTLTSTTAGLSDVTASITNDQNITSNQVKTVKFVANTSTKHLTISATGNNAIANGTETNVVEVNVVDANNNPFANENVEITVPAGVTISTVNGAAYSAATGFVSDSEGKVVLTLISHTANTYAITSRISSADASTTITFIADSNTATLNRLEVITVDGVLADGQQMNSVLVNVTDANGNALSGQQVTFTASGSANVVDFGKTDTNGNVTIYLTDTVAEESDVEASMTNAKGEVSRKNGSVRFVADSDNPIINGLEVMTPNGVAADGEHSNSVTVTVTDAMGNPLAGKKINFTASGDNVKVLAFGETDDYGQITIHLTDTVAEEVDIVASIANAKGEESRKNSNVTFIADTNTAKITGFTANGTKVAGGEGETTVQVKVTDKYGNILPNQVVTFTANNDATISSTATTNAEGMIVLPLNSKKAVLVTVTATVGNAEPKEIGVQFIADVKTAKIVAGNVTVEDDRALIGGEKTNSVKVKVIDANNNNVPGLTVVLTADNGASVGKIAETNADGEVLVTLTSNTTGASKVTASLTNSAAQESHEDVTVTFIAQILDKDFMPGSNSAAANNKALNSVYAKVTDSKGKGVANQQVTFTVENTEDNNPTFSNDGTTITVTTDENGAATVTLKNTKAGPTTVTATLFDSSPTATVDFVGDSATRRIVVGNLTVETDNAVADGQATNSVKVKITDENDNPLPGELVTLTAKIYNGTVNVGNVAKTDTNGEVVVTLTSTTAGLSDVTASITNDQNITSNQVKTVKFIPNINSMTFTLVTTQNNAGANGLDSNIVEVNVFDANNNAIANQKVAITIPSGVTVTQVNGAAYSAAAGFVTDSEGQIVIKMTSNTVGSAKVTGQLNSVELATDITFVPSMGSDTTAVLSASRILNNDNASGTTGGLSTLTLKLVDDKGKIVTGMANNIVLTPDQTGLNIGKLTETATKGTYTATVTSLTANSYNIVLSFNNGIAYTTTLPLLVYTYDFALNVQDKKLGEQMIYEYALTAVESDTKTVVSVSNVTATWSSSNTSAATIVGSNSTATVTAVKEGETTISADNIVLNGVKGSVTADSKLQVVVLNTYGPYGNSTSDKSPERMLISPDNGYTLSARGGHIVDAMGTKGGSGGGQAPINKLNLVSAVKITTCKFSNDDVIGQMIFSYRDGSTQQEVGMAKCTLSVKTYEVTFKDNEHLVGFDVYNSASRKYLGGVTLLTLVE